MKMRHAAATLLTTAITSTALLTVTAPGADAAPAPERAAAKGCVTKAEYRKAKKGMTPAKVSKIFGTKGKKSGTYPLPGGGKVIGIGYKACTSKRGAVGISYTVKPGKQPALAKKVAQWR